MMMMAMAQGSWKVGKIRLCVVSIPIAEIRGPTSQFRNRFSGSKFNSTPTFVHFIDSDTHHITEPQQQSRNPKRDSLLSSGVDAHS